MGVYQGPQVIPSHAEVGKPTASTIPPALTWRPQETHRLAVGSETTGAAVQALLGPQVVSSVSRKGEPSSGRPQGRPRGPRNGLPAEPAQSLSAHGHPKDSRPRDVTRPQRRAPGRTPSRPGPLGQGQLAPGPLPGHNGSSRPGNSRLGGGGLLPQGRPPARVQTFSRDASMAEAAGGAR